MIDYGSKENLKELLKHQIEVDRIYKGLSLNESILIKRSINTAYTVIAAVESLSFEQLGIVLYIKTKNSDFLNLIKNYEFQIEEAKLNKENFVNNLHEFYMRMAKNILENKLRIFFDFLNFIVSHSKKTKYEKVFNSYVNLLMQQCYYFAFLLNRTEEICCGITSENELLFIKDPLPFSDCASYDIMIPMYKALKNNRQVEFNIIKKAYKKWGYDIQSMDDITALDCICRNFANNNIIMMPYINEYTQQLIPLKHFTKFSNDFPRTWLQTEVYEEKLSSRKYTLPSSGIYAKYINAGSIRQILFQEIYKDEKIILLYKITLKNGEEYSGYYNASDKEFYSIFQQSNFKEYDKNIKNFILENYYILTCENDIHRKRNYMIKQVENLDNEKQEFPYQILTQFSYKKSVKNKKNKTSLFHYDRTKYVKERKTINGFIRKLPEGQSASESAKILAKKLGYNLNDNETFVKPFQKNVLKIKIYNSSGKPLI